MQPKDYIPNDFGSPESRSTRPFIGSGHVTGPLLLVETRGKIAPKEGSSWELNADGTAIFATARAGTSRVSLVERRVEWDGATHNETIKAKIEETQDATTSVLRIDPAQLNVANQRAWIALTSSNAGGTNDRIDLRTGTGIVGDTRISMQGTLLTQVAGTTLEARTESATASRSRLVLSQTEANLITNDTSGLQLARLLLSQTGASLRKFASGGVNERSGLTLDDTSIVMASKNASGVTQGSITVDQAKITHAHVAANAVHQFNQNVIIPVNVDPTLASTAHPLTVGATATPHLKLGPTIIQGNNGAGAANVMQLNPLGGAITGRSYQIAPVRATSGHIVGSGASASSTTQLFFMQCGYATVSFTAGQGTLTLPATFANGIIAFVATAGSTSEDVLLVVSATTSAVTLGCYRAGVALNGTSTNVSWIAIGW